MPNYTQLKVFKEAYDLLTLVYQTTSNISRVYRYTLVEEIKNDATEPWIQIYRANLVRETKVSSITAAQEILIRVTIQCRMLGDMRQISTKLSAQITLHPNKLYLQPAAHGVEFLGVKIRNGARLPGRRISTNAIEAMHARFHSKEAVPMVNAYLGVLRHMNAYDLRRQIVQMIQPPILHALQVHPAFLAVKSITPASS